MATKKKTEESKEVILTPEELVAIESQRRDVELLSVFREEYQALVDKTGFSWVIDATSPLNNLQLGIGRAQK